MMIVMIVNHENVIYSKKFKEKGLSQNGMLYGKSKVKIIFQFL